MSKNDRKENVRVVIRRLPKLMTEEEVLEQISPLPEEVIYHYFLPANQSFESLAFASLYLVFNSFCESLLDFEARFNGYVFVDSQGNDSAAVVEAATNEEYAEYNRELMKKDAKIGIITEDPYYKNFVLNLESEKELPIMTVEQQIARLVKGNDVKTLINQLETPLVKYFLDKAEAKKWPKSSSKHQSEFFSKRERNENGKEKQKATSSKNPVKVEKEKNGSYKLNDKGEVVKLTRKERREERLRIKSQEALPKFRDYRQGIRETTKLKDHLDKKWIEKLTDRKPNLKSNVNSDSDNW